jgi:DNA-binding winged helix-turn-helix (wHTH) protein
MDTHPLPLTFRHAVVNQIFSSLQAGDSCAIVGVGSVGKSNLLRFLQRPDVQQTNLGGDAEKFLLAYVDMNKLLKKSLWGLLELMLHQLMLEAAQKGIDEKSLQIIDRLHQKATRPKNRFLTLRYLDRALSIVCSQPEYRVVFLFDEFDDLCRALAPRGFASLRALRDDYKYQLMYVVTSRLELKRLRVESSEIEPFEEIVSPRTIWLGPYAQSDAQYMLNRLETRYNNSLDKKMTRLLLETTGGHPGLLREAFHSAYKTVPNLLEELSHSSQVQDECQRIWLSLTSGEQQLMIDLSNNNEPQTQHASALEKLQRKGLVGGAWAKKTAVFSSLFATYVKRHHPVASSTFVVNPKHRSVWINGHEISKFTRLEFSLIEYLDKKRGQICSWDELARHLYPNETAYEGDGVTDNRIASVVKRLRKRIEPNQDEPQYIITERGHGIRLVVSVGG